MQSVLFFYFLKKIKNKNNVLLEDVLKYEKKNEQLLAVYYSLYHDLRSKVDDCIFGEELIKEEIKYKKTNNLTNGFSLLSTGLEGQNMILEGIKEWVKVVDFSNKELKKEKTDLRVLFSDFFKKANYRGQVHISRIFPSLFINKELFLNAIDNLVKNGLSNSDKKCKIVKIYSEKDCIIVEDNGIGLEKTEFEKLRKPFQSNKRNENNIGLGLPIVNAILNVHNFNLNVEGTKGVGTKFIINTNQKGIFE